MAIHYPIEPSNPGLNLFETLINSTLLIQRPILVTESRLHELRKDSVVHDITISQYNEGLLETELSEEKKNGIEEDPIFIRFKKCSLLAITPESAGDFCKLLCEQCATDTGVGIFEFDDSENV